MRLSNKSTFSLVCFILILALAFTAMPAMAQTIEAVWSTDRNNDNAATDPGWRITLGGLAADDTVTVTAVVPGGAAVDAGDIGTFNAVATDATTTTGDIAATIGTVIAVRVAKTTAGVTSTYQRVTFPAGGAGATLASANLTLIPKLAKLTTPKYYVNFANNMATVVFNFEAVEADSHGAPGAPLHISDVTVNPTTNWQIVSVTGNNMVNVRATHATSADSDPTIVSLNAAYALAADADDPVNVPGNGTAQVIYDNMPPTATIGANPVRAVTLSSDFATPEVDENTVWDEAFFLTVSIDDNSASDTNSVGAELKVANISVDTAKLRVVQVGEAATQNDAVVGTEYLIHIMPLPGRVTTAGEEVEILVTPVDRAGNAASTPARHTVKLAEKKAPPPGPATIPTPALGSTTAGGMLTVVFSKNPGTVTATGYTITGTGTTRMIAVPAAQAAGNHSIALAWTGPPSGSGTVTFTVTVDLTEVETETSSAVFTIQPESFVVIVRDVDAMDAEGINFRTDVTVLQWSSMPDLERLFYRGNQGIILGNGGGGALILNESAIQTKDRRVGSVGISEIMWGINKGLLGTLDAESEPREHRSQWIELHNLNAVVEDNADTMDVNEADDGVAKVFLSWKTGRDISSDSALTGNLASPTLDVVTNFFNNRPGSAAWDVKGSSGDSISGEDFASMARILPDKKAAYANADGARYDNRDGRNAGHWSASSSAYLNARTTRADTTDVVYQYKGTPGRVNNVSVDSQPHIKAGRTGIPSNDVTINEVGNSDNDSYDWIELKGAAGKNLRNYMISIVTSNSSDVPLVQFAANDNAKIADNGVFLILRTDPADNPDHPIAATGYNVDKSAEEQQPGTPNSPVRYKVFSGLNLPNDGKFVLILRKPDNHEGHRSGAHNDKGVAETGNADLNRIVDIAGWDDNLSKDPYPNPVSSTSLWPLHGFAGPFTNRNAFFQNTVHRRQYVTTNDGRSGVGAHENKNQDDRAAFRDIGWTGVGYRRGAADTAANGGTPGYDNGSLHGAGGTITAAVYISEIMYADARNGSLPQWIELRNPSNTVGANLHNWRLTIINHVDAETHEDGLWDGKVEASVLLRNLKIKPNGVVLITSRRGPRSEVHLATDDIFSLFPTHRSAFGMTNANSDVINQFGFRITLHANGHEGDRNKWQLVDDVGNLVAPDANDRRGNNERFDEPRWSWPDANTADDARISVVRKVKSKDTLEPTDGSKLWSWLLADADPRTTLIDHVYYGHTDDTSTPGQTVGSPLPVSLSFFRPTLEDGKVVIRWTTESELDNAGFNIYRSEDRNGEFTKVNDQLIQGKGTTAERSTYKWVDTSAKPGAVYYYQIEDVSFAGERQTLTTTKLKGLISAKDKLTTKWGELKEVQ